MHSLFDPLSVADRNIRIGGGHNHVRAADGSLSTVEVLYLHVLVGQLHLLNELFPVLGLPAKDVDLLNRSDKADGFNGGGGLPTEPMSAMLTAFFLAI